MKLSKKRKIAVLSLTAVMASSLALNAFVGDYKSGVRLPASEASTSASSGITFEEVDDGLDTSSIFSQYYDPDVVKINDIKENDKRVAIVNLDEKSLMDYAKNSGKTYGEYAATLAAADAARTIEKRIKAFKNELKSNGIQAEILYTYNTITTGVALKATGSELNKISRLESVDSVVLSERYAVPEVIEISNDTNVYSTGIYNTSEVSSDLRGDGMLIAVLDTGMDVQHDAFQVSNFNANTFKLKKSDVQNKLKDLCATELDKSATAETLYKSSKLPFAFDYADKDTNVYPSYSSHGVHVSGIIAGNHTKISQATVDSDDDLKFDYDTENQTHYFEGVVPDAQIATFKVFTDDIDAEGLGGADTEDILSALEDAVKIGVDVINMSLGSSGGFSTYADEYMTLVYGKIEEAGISLVCAASNDYSSGYGGENGTNLTSNPDSATVGSPSTYPAAISVASINGQKDPYMVANPESDVEAMVFYTEATDGNSNKMDFVENTFTVLRDKGAMGDSDTRVELDYVVIPGLGRSFNYTESIKAQLKAKPTIALVQRGTTTFEEKMKIAKENGAVAIMIYNNVAGSISMTMGAKDLSEIIPSCSISMDTGNKLVNGAAKADGYSMGKIVLDKSKYSGPFMSAFSSWGPTPSLSLKPEITAYGGNVTSSVAGGYAVYSGTSMASPNMAGAVAIIRQNLKKQHPEWTPKQIHDRTYQIMMSTSGIVLDERGIPYSPRKQGSGIADIDASLSTQSYLYVKDSNGNVDSKTKIELFDDPEKKGEYSFTFYLENTSVDFAQYSASYYVMTETVSSDGKTVAEKGLILDDATVKIYVDGKESTSKRINADGGATVTIKVDIALSAANKKYLDDNFKNGMYVEGFIVLEQTTADGDNKLNDLSIPFLAFYGDWTDAPILDYSVFEVAENQADDSIPDEDKIKIDFWSTTPYSKYGEDYILPIGTYLYKLPDTAEKIYASEDKAAISMYNEATHSTAYQFYAVYAGLLRGMATCNAKIVNEFTGETVWHNELINVSKGYANGGSTRPGFIKIEFSPYEMNLPGNTKFHFYMEGFLDYGDGKQGNKNTFDFSFYTDYEAPTLVDVGLRYEDYVDANDETHTRIYLDITTFDNLYTQAILPLYVNEDNSLTLLQQYIVPVYSDVKGSTVKTSIEITDYYEDYFDNIRIQVEDYAMNYRIYSLDLSTAIAKTFPEKIEFEEQELELTAGDAVKPAFTVTPSTAQHYDLVWRSSNESVVRVEKGEIYAVGAGEAYVTVYGTNDNVGTVDAASARIKVVVKDGTSAQKYAQPEFGLIFNSSKTPVNPTNSVVEVDPNEYIQLNVKSNPWYLPQAEFTWSSQNELVATVDKNGLVHTLKEGTAIITAEQVGTNGVLSVSVTLSVGPEFVISSYVLTEYHGLGGDVVVPDELNFMYIDEECFMGNTAITSFIVPDDVTEIREKAFYGCTNLKSITLPKSLTLVENSAFEGCTSLETVDMSKALSIIFSHRCFYGCTSLKEIKGSITAIWDYTFAGCTSLEELDITRLVQTGKYSFANCTGLKNITASIYSEIGEGMFFGCTGLEKLELPVKYVGKDAFYACSNLEELTLTGHCVLGEGAFRECDALSKLYFAGDVYEIGERAFEGCKNLVVLVLPNNAVFIGENAFSRCNALKTLGLQPNTSLSSPQAFRNCGSWDRVIGATVVKNGDSYDLELNTPINNYSVKDKIIYNKEETEIVLIPRNIKSEDLTLPSTLERIGDGAFYGLTGITSVTIPEGVTEIGDYAFSYSCVESVNIPASVTKLGVGTFAYCYTLREVTFAADSKLTEIPEGCFNTTFDLSTVVLPASVKTIGDYAFGESGIKTLYAAGTSAVKEGVFDGSGFAALETIGLNAFASTKFEKVELPQTLKALSNHAFALCPELNEVTFNSKVSMDSFVFFDSTHLTTVTFFDEMTDIGTYTFTSTAGQPSLKTVVLPSSLTDIGEFAFWGCIGLEEITIPEKVRSIGTYAFYKCSSLENIDLSNVEYIGDYAFSETGALQKANLKKAVHIGDYAFYQSGLTEVKVPVLKYLGNGGLAYTNITEIALPASLESVGNGSLHYNFYLKGISLGDNGKNDKFFIDDLGEAKNYGVLYSVLPDGSYQVEAYPGGNAVKEYSVLEGTSRIGEMAFTGAITLNEVYCPVTLVTIGDKGFYDCRANYYEFTSFIAPNLEAHYINGDSYSSDEWLYIIFARNGENYDERYYANFYYYAMYSVYAEYDFGLTLSYPSNASGYDEYIWSIFFSDTYTIDETIDDNTLNAIKTLKKFDIERLKALQSADASDAAIKREVEGYAKLLKEAYGYASNITSETQMNFFTGDYDGVDYSEVLAEIQALMQTLKSKFGIVSEIIRIRIKVQPTKTTYVLNETIDTTGMVVEAEYDDGVKSEITDYTLDHTTAYVVGESVRITVKAGNATASFRIKVTEADETEQPPVEKHKNFNYMIIVYIVIGLVVAGGAAVGAVFLVKYLKKKSAASEATETTEGNTAEQEVKAEAPAATDETAESNPTEQETKAEEAPSENTKGKKGKSKK